MRHLLPLKTVFATHQPLRNVCLESQESLECSYNSMVHPNRLGVHPLPAWGSNLASLQMYRFERTLRLCISWIRLVAGIEFVLEIVRISILSPVAMIILWCYLTKIVSIPKHTTQPPIKPKFQDVWTPSFYRLCPVKARVCSIHQSCPWKDRSWF